MNFYFIVSKTSSGYMLIMKRPDNDESAVYMNMTKSDIYQTVSVEMDSFMFGGNEEC